MSPASVTLVAKWQQRMIEAQYCKYNHLSEHKLHLIIVMYLEHRIAVVIVFVKTFFHIMSTT